VIEFPEWAEPNGAEPYAIPFGGWMTPPTGGEELFVERKGGRFGAGITYPPMRADRAAVLISRLTEAWFSGSLVRVEYPLVGVSQGTPGEPVIDGAGQSGRTINLRGLNPGYIAKEGYWLTIVDQNGRGYLHNNRSLVHADADGNAAVIISPEVRWPFLDGAMVRIAKPTIEGKVAAQPWQLPLNHLVQVGFDLREIA
jgi:hypothetical protein